MDLLLFEVFKLCKVKHLNSENYWTDSKKC